MPTTSSSESKNTSGSLLPAVIALAVVVALLCIGFVLAMIYIWKLKKNASGKNYIICRITLNSPVDSFQYIFFVQIYTRIAFYIKETKTLLNVSILFEFLLLLLLFGENFSYTQAKRKLLPKSIPTFWQMTVK